MLGGLGVTELLIILGIVLLLFGARRVPELGAGLGKAIRSFKEALSDGSKETPSSPTDKK